ncbi:MAG: DUF3060 domain-containing protein [Pyrinomonadaceae bacterium]
MNIVFTILLMGMIGILTSCDVRSGIAKEEMEKYNPTPTPTFAPIPSPSPVDPADMLTVDTTLEGQTIAVNSYSATQTVACKKFNRVMVNGDDNVITIKGVCRQIMVNGDRNKITGDAAMEFVLNGTENTVNYAYFANGRRPSVIEGRAGNIIQKISVNAVSTKQRGDKKAK